MIIGLIGKSMSGKDTVANLMKTYFNTLALQNFKAYWEVKHFAYKLKEIAAILSNEPLSDFLTETGKMKACPEYLNFDGETLTLRDFLQKLGTEIFRENFNEDIWVNALLSGYKPYYKGEISPAGEMLNHLSCKGCGKPYSGWERQYFCNDCIADPTIQIMPNWIIADVRFHNEAKAIKKHNGILIKIDRGIKSMLTESQREHQSETELEMIKPDYTIDNNFDLDNLNYNVVKFCENYVKSLKNSVSLFSHLFEIPP